MLENIEVLFHSSIRMAKQKIIYIDPFKIQKNFNDADIIFITHDHFDHYSEEDIERVKKENTIIVAPENLKEKILKNDFKEEKVISVKPNEKYHIENIEFETVPAYNVNKKFHPKSQGWVGYIIQIDTIRYYIAGDTDETQENKNVKCDVAFVPVGGTYTMNYKEAAHLVNDIKPKIAVPIHYGSVVGSIEDAQNFVKLLNPQIKSTIFKMEG